MRVLFATPRFPGRRARGDQTRAWQQLRHLAPRHEITLLTCESADPRESACDEVLRLCERVVVLPRPRGESLMRLARAPFGTRPLQCAWFDAWPAPAALRRVVDEGRFDLAHVQMARLAQVFARLAPLPRVLDLVDALSLNMQRRAEKGSGPMAWLARVEAARLPPLERTLCAQSEAVVISAAPDRDALGTDAGAHLVANGFDPDLFPFVPERESSARIVFGANLGYAPNVDAARWFVAEVLPRIRRVRPDALLQLVGARPARALRRLAAGRPDVHLIGPVPHMHPWLAQAAVAVSPLRQGSGQQLKLFEAMASGTPLVASSLSAASIDARDGEHLRIAADAAEMADVILTLLQDRDHARQLARGARALVERRYTWAHAADALERVWLAAAR